MGVVESIVQRQIIGYLRGLDDTYVVNIGGGASSAKGTPDLLVCYKGRFCGFEIKRPDGSYGLTKPQEMRLAAIRRAGGVTGVLTSVEETIAVLAMIDNREV